MRLTTLERFRRPGGRPKRPDRVSGHFENQREHARGGETIRERSRSSGLLHAVNRAAGRQPAKRVIPIFLGVILVPQKVGIIFFGIEISY